MTTPLIVRQRQDVATAHRTSSILTELAVVQNRADQTARSLETAARRHHRNLTQLAHLRAALGLDAQPVPGVDELVSGIPRGWFSARIVRRDRLTADSKTSGSMRMADGKYVEWVAGAFYVDTLEPLFNDVPVIVSGTYKGQVFSIAAIAVAPAHLWPEGTAKQHAALAQYDGRHITRITAARTGLLTQHKSRCQDCDGELPKASKASLIKHADGYRLVCRPCKQAWIDACRPTEDVAK